MKQECNKSDFVDAFRRIRPDEFSYDALSALYDYLEEVYVDDHEYILDVIALCCEFHEDKIENVLREYNLATLDELRVSTCVVWENGEDVLYAGF